MRISSLIMTVLIVCAAVSIDCSGAHPPKEKIDRVLSMIEWTGQAGFIIHTGTKIIRIDPYNLLSYEKTDIIFITHGHPDHLSPADIGKVAKPSTIMVSSKLGRFNLPASTSSKSGIVALAPGEKATVGGIIVEATFAYDDHEHSKDSEDVGFIITIDGVRIYHVGGTTAIPEMKQYRADIVIVPVGAAYGIEGSAQIVKEVGAAIAIPMHFNCAWGGTDEDVAGFRKLVGNAAEVVVLTKK
jgi:L-ascorbate metabolism protein UlaG (beta-lactamase superfamily)